MFRVWGKIFKDNHMLRDTVVCDDSNDTRTHKVMRALEEMCYTFDLGKPIWHAKTRFHQDSFVEEIDFDYLEFQVIEED